MVVPASPLTGPTKWWLPAYRTRTALKPSPFGTLTTVGAAALPAPLTDGPVPSSGGGSAVHAAVSSSRAAALHLLHLWACAQEAPDWIRLLPHPGVRDGLAALLLYGHAAALDALAADANDPPGPFPPRRAVVKRLYEPEYAKFGGPDGVALAERLMQRGSEAALLCAGPRHRARRTTIAAAHTHLVTAHLPPTQRTAFLHQYAWYWAGRGRRDAPSPRALPRLAPGDARAVRRAEVLHGRVGDVLADRELGPVLGSYADDFWRLVGEAGLARPDYLTAFHHIHLMNNRLGVVPGEEFQIARLLWLHRIAGAARAA
ncbi:lantibiotic dehydratase C-terminal domain-containing protein [Kitasatospora sp. NPDC059577]|uniref:lantibiotic dehydratase C-terminal domain-containing protein n=1 Tax=Kitasatospora sp. NPDC059577 TaxID=3346873 RepID=UPI0036B0AEAB